MSKVGIIANPASGKDIRRLVSHATVISNAEKTDVIRRVILGLDSTGVEEVWIMPDFYGLGLRAMEALSHHSLKVQVSIMDMVIEGTQEDSVRAARIMEEAKMDCIVTLGGDGTNRVVSKACGQVPLIPISTGTNNVFPVMNEGTTAGMAAGILARRNSVLRRARHDHLARAVGLQRADDAAAHADAVHPAEQADEQGGVGRDPEALAEQREEERHVAYAAIGRPTSAERATKRAAFGRAMAVWYVPRAPSEPGTDDLAWRSDARERGVSSGVRGEAPGRGPGGMAPRASWCAREDSNLHACEGART